MRALTTLPKAHLHVHLENAVRWSTVVEIGQANGVAVPHHLVDGRYRFDGFADFFDQNHLVRSCLRRPEDFRRIALEYCEDEAAQGTRYAEVSFTAAAHGERVGDLALPLEAVLDGLAEGRARYGIETAMVLDHSRRRSVERAWQTVELATAHTGRGVVAVGLAGDEAYPADPFAEVFRAARAAGLHCVHHAGEAEGAASIRSAIHAVGAERLGHGIRVLDDDELVAEVRDRAIPLEVCPSSNVALGFVAAFADHPLPRLLDAGLVVTLNTDIPSMISTPLATEFARVRDAFGYDDTTMAALARAGVDASFAPDDLKMRLHRDIDAWLAAGSTSTRPVRVSMCARGAAGPARQ
jgi:adenosine deaminase